MNKRGQQNDFIKQLGILILLIPLWWILGFKIFIFHITSFMFFISMIFKHRQQATPIRISISHGILLMFISIYFSSILIHFFIREPIRIIASLYNLSYWIMGFLIMVVIYNIKFIDKEQLKEKVIYLSNCFRKLGLIQGFMSFPALLWWVISKRDINYASVLYALIPDFLRFNLIESSSILRIVRTDWIYNQRLPRLTGFFVYPTALGIGMAVILCMALIYYKQSKLSKFRIIIEICIMAIPLIFCLSRTVLVSIMIVLLVMLMIWLISKGKKSLLIIGISCITIIVSMLIYEQVGNGLSMFLESRAGSTSLRGMTYSMAVSTALENPIIGIGVKYYIPGIDIPIGSHSTYIGTLLKTGIIGLSLLIVFLTLIFREWAKTKSRISDPFLEYIWRCIGAAFMLVSLWMLTEDIDSPQIIALFYFIICGIIMKLNSISFSKNYFDRRKGEKKLKGGVDDMNFFHLD